MEKPLEYGQRLASAREALGVSLEEVSYELKINLSILKKLEASESRGLPKPAFTKGFIKAYCKMLKIGPDLIVSEYEKTLTSSVGEFSKGVLLEEQKPKELFILDILRERFLPVLVFVSVLAAVFVLYSFLGSYESSHKVQNTAEESIEFSDQEDVVVEEGKTKAPTFEIFDKERFKGQKDSSIAEQRIEKEVVVEVEVEEKKEQQEQELIENTEKKNEPSVEVAKETPKYIPPTGKHILVVEPLEDTSLYIKTNLDKRPIKASLKLDKVRRFQFDQAEIRFLDAGAVSLTLDGEYIGALGGFGEEKKVDFPSLKDL